MKRLLIVFLAILLSFSKISYGQSYQDSIGLILEVTPNPPYDQVETGKSYMFLLTIENLNLTLEEGDVVEQPDGLFSGNLIVKTEYLLGKSGYLTYGSNSMIYGAIIDSWERTYTVGLPESGGSANVSIPYSCTQSYDPRNATVSEWLKLMLKITVYIEVYSDEEQNMTFRNSPAVASHEASYFIINDEKKLYVNDKLIEIENEIDDAMKYRDLIENITGQAFYLDLSAPMSDYIRMKDFVDSGDYVSAMNTSRYWWYDLKQELIDSLLTNYETYMGYKAMSVQYRDQLAVAEVELSQLIEVNQYYLAGIIGLGALSTIIFLSPKLRVSRKRVEPKKAEPEEPAKPKRPEEEPEIFEEPETDEGPEELEEPMEIEEPMETEEQMELEEPEEMEEPEQPERPRRRVRPPEMEDVDLERARALLE